MNEYQCEVCGKVELDDYRIKIYHRGCRLAAAFPDAVIESGRGMTALDMSKIDATLDHPTLVTRDGVQFERWPDGQISISVHTRVGNRLSDWSWWIGAEDWETVVSALARPPLTPSREVAS